MIDRKTAHELLDTLLDAIGREESANDPDAAARAEDEAVKAFGNLTAELMGPIFALRRGAELSGIRQSEETNSASARYQSGREALVRLGSAGVPASRFNAKYAPDSGADKHLRSSIGRSLLDAELAGIIQSGVGTMLHLALQQTNVGVSTYSEFFWPKKKQGERLTSGDIAIFTAIARDVYYLVGYRNISIKATFDLYINRIGLGLDFEAFRKRLERDRIPGLRVLCAAARKQGETDRAAGSAEAPPHAALDPSLMRILYLARAP